MEFARIFFFFNKSLAHTHLSTNVVKQRAEYLCLHGQDVWRVPLVEPVPHELLKERFGRSGRAKVERDWLDGYDGASRETGHRYIFVVVEKCAAWGHHCEIRRGSTEWARTMRSVDEGTPVLGFDVMRIIIRLGLYLYFYGKLLPVVGHLMLRLLSFQGRWRDLARICLDELRTPACELANI